MRTKRDRKIKKEKPEKVKKPKKEKVKRHKKEKLPKLPKEAEMSRRQKKKRLKLKKENPIKSEEVISRRRGKGRIKGLDTLERNYRKFRKDKVLVFFVATILVGIALLLSISVYNQARISNKREAKASQKAEEIKNSSSSGTKEPVLPDEGPVLALAANFPDPAVIYAEGNYYMYSTNAGPQQQLPMATSTDIRGFQEIGQALPYRPSYGNNASTKSPFVAYVDGKYIMYVGTSIGPNLQRLYVIGTAVSDSPAGPFIPTESALIGAPEGSGDNFFDPDLYSEDGKNYLFYSTDGTLGPNIWVRELTEDGLSLHPEGESTMVLDAAQVQYPDGRDTPRVESSTLVKAEDGMYVLLYAGGNAEEPDCFIGYAISENITGPYENQGPLITTETFQNHSFNGPGEVSSFSANGKNYLTFNGWIGEHNKFEVIWGGRYVYNMEYTWKDGHIPYFNTNVVE